MWTAPSSVRCDQAEVDRSQPQRDLHLIAGQRRRARRWSRPASAPAARAGRWSSASERTDPDTPSAVREAGGRVRLRRPRVVRVGAARAVVAIASRARGRAGRTWCPTPPARRTCARPSSTRRTWSQPCPCSRRPCGRWRRPRRSRPATRARSGRTPGCGCPRRRRRSRTDSGWRPRRSGPRRPGSCSAGSGHDAGISLGTTPRRYFSSPTTSTQSRLEPDSIDPERAVPVVAGEADPGRVVQAQRLGARVDLHRGHEGLRDRRPWSCSTSCRWPLDAARLEPVGARRQELFAMPWRRPSVIPDDAPKSTAEPDDKQHALGARSAAAARRGCR